MTLDVVDYILRNDGRLYHVGQWRENDSPTTDVERPWYLEDQVGKRCVALLDGLLER